MLSLRYIISLALLSVLATACTKEAAVEPCSGSSEHTEGSAKDRPLSLTDGPDPVSHEGDTAEPVTDDNVGGDDQGISDDGDDISDSEKTRKKRR